MQYWKHELLLWLPMVEAAWQKTVNLGRSRYLAKSAKIALNTTQHFYCVHSDSSNALVVSKVTRRL